MALRIKPGYLVAALAVLTLGCGALGVRGSQESGGPSPSVAAQSPTSSPSLVPSTKPPAAAETSLVLSVNGIGPFTLGTGATLDQLQATGQIASVGDGGEACPQFFGAQGNGPWSGVRLWFRPDRTLDFVIARDQAIRTPSGAHVGSTLAELQSIYGSRGEVLTSGSAKAYIVRVASSGRAIFFELDIANAKVVAMFAGGSDRLAQRFLNGADC
ncbi:MAG TPA: hypothetical protein VFC00_34760 [Micromonosporaceae bacterium]|nr:hypothetical protein [Micromonosporaceae bacterium]